ncbi:hypothetical protein NMG60_11018177 [Bertholletia excelsa]
MEYNFSSIFPLKQANELVFQPTVQPEETVGHSSLASSNLVADAAAAATGKSRRRGSAANREGDESGGNKQEKRIVHRDIERQRRQEMSSLYASLRSLLPLEYIKGKRSASDHMHEAVNYIKDLQKNIRELEIERDKQIKLPSSCSTGGTGSFCSCSSSLVIVTTCRGGMEILISSCCGFPLSKVLSVLVQEGFNVVSCSSAEVNGRLLHTVRSEVHRVFISTMFGIWIL